MIASSNQHLSSNTNITSSIISDLVTQCNMIPCVYTSVFPVKQKVEGGLRHFEVIKPRLALCIIVYFACLNRFALFLVQLCFSAIDGPIFVYLRFWSFSLFALIFPFIFLWKWTFLHLWANIWFTCLPHGRRRSHNKGTPSTLQCSSLSRSWQLWKLSKTLHEIRILRQFVSLGI